MMTFRQFIEADMAAAPAGGTPPSSDDGQAPTKSHDDLNVLGRELDISPDDLRKALKDTPILSFSPIYQKGKNRGSGPQVIFPDKINPGFSMDGKLMQGNMQKLRNPNGSKADGPEMQPIHFRNINRGDASYTLPNVWLEPFRKQKQQMSAGGGMPGMPPGAGALYHRPLEEFNVIQRIHHA